MGDKMCIVCVVYDVWYVIGELELKTTCLRFSKGPKNFFVTSIYFAAYEPTSGRKCVIKQPSFEQQHRSSAGEKNGDATPAIFAIKQN